VVVYVNRATKYQTLNRGARYRPYLGGLHVEGDTAGIVVEALLSRHRSIGQAGRAPHMTEDDL
jgi:hypothetical protein